jgi:hypothetical protein
MAGTIKTIMNDASVEDFIQSVENKIRQEDSAALLEIYKQATNEEPRMWGSAMIGFGMYHYKSERSSQEGDWPLAAFSPRKQNLTLYVMSDIEDYTDLLSMLGKHKTSKACLYINKLADVDLEVLAKIVKKSYLDAKNNL